MQSVFATVFGVNASKASPAGSMRAKRSESPGSGDLNAPGERAVKARQTARPAPTGHSNPG
jgi:hypothetical protein